MSKRFSAFLALLLAITPACRSGPEENEYYIAYLQLEQEVMDMGAQLDSALIRIRDLESAIAGAVSELEAAQASAREAQLVAGRDPASAEFHAQSAQERLTAVIARLRAAQ